MLERRIAHIAKRGVRAHLSPDHFRELRDRRALGSSEIDVLVERRWVLDACSNSARQIPSVGVVPDLGAVPEDVKRFLAARHLLDQVLHDVAHREIDIATRDFAPTERPHFAGAHTAEGPDYRVRQTELLVRAAGDVLTA